MKEGRKGLMSKLIFINFYYIQKCRESINKLIYVLIYVWDKLVRDNGTVLGPSLLVFLFATRIVSLNAP